MQTTDYLDKQTVNTNNNPKSIDKITFVAAIVFTAILFGGLSGAAGYYLKKETPAQKKDCDYNDKTYSHGEIFYMEDECNKCLCDNGDLVCTDVDCEAEISECSSDFVYEFNEADTGNDIILKCGDTIKVSSSVKPSTGYSLEDPIYDSEFLELIDEETSFYNPDPPIAGGDSETTTWTFKSIKTGTTELTVNIYREWDADETRQEVFSAIIVIGSGLLRICPDEWYKNEMPTIGDNNEQLEYFIIDGERREIDEFDYDWVMENCNLDPVVVE